MSDHTHGVFYPGHDSSCQECKRKDKRIEELEGAMRDVISSLYVGVPPYYQIHFDVLDSMEAALKGVESNE